MKKILFTVIILLPFFSMAQLPFVTNGSIKRFENFSSKYIAARNVDVWLPKNYSAAKKYAVLYMHDGQMLYDSSITWNKQEWQVDEKVSKLIEEKAIIPIIVVGIWNSGKTRHADYFPEKALNYLPDSTQKLIIENDLLGKPQADNYLNFLVKELKPFIDSSFSTYKDKAHTFIAGSSMGGLISFYAFCEYNKVFGAAACLSTHWIGSLKYYKPEIPHAFYQYAAKNLPKAGNGKLYFDFGTKTLDSLYQPHQTKMDKLLISKKYNATNWKTNIFVGADHSEKAWANRLEQVLTFLIGK